MVITMAKSEIKNLLREKMTAIMLLYPFLLGGIGRYVIEAGIVEGQAMGVIAILLALVTGFVFGASAGFSLLDDRDDQVLISIQISPVSLKLYIALKVGLLYLLAVLGSFFVIWFIGAIDLSAGEILLVSAVASLQTPIAAFLINSFANNKVEGFVTMKGSGFLLMLPAAGYFFLDAKEWLFALAPGHWVAKALQYALLRPQIEAGLVQMNLTFAQYVGIGLAYNLLLIAVVYRLFGRKVDV